MTQDFLLRQVHNLALLTNDESIAKQIYKTSGKKLQIPGKLDPPFIYLGLIDDYNGVDINQYRECIELRCANCVK